jgi:cephalosporin hydroxylase
MSQVEEFRAQVRRNIDGLGQDKDMRDLSRIWLRDSLKHQYTYNFQWLSRPIIQYPQDILAMQELVWQIRPDLIIETGIAHGGSLIMSASMLALLDYCDAVEAKRVLDPLRTKRRVLGIDIDIRKHNRTAIESHPLSNHIQMVQGSSVDPEVISGVRKAAQEAGTVLVCLDSHHTHAHVLAELEAYASLVTPGSYCIVFDTVIEDLPGDTYPNRDWGCGNNPKTAVWEFLKSHPEFEIDKSMENKLSITVAPDGYLRRKSA